MNLPELRRYFLVGIFLLFFAGVCFNASAQCAGSVSLKKAAVESDTSQGVIEIEVKTSGDFICTLSIEKGSGPVKVQEKRGRGNSIVSFVALESNQSYKVDVEFLSEDQSALCRVLQKSGISLQSDLR